MAKGTEGFVLVDRREPEERKEESDPLDHATILRCIGVLEKRAVGLKERGMSSWSFFFGVLNLLLVTWCFGVVPQHFWLLYVFETLVLFPLRWRHMISARPLSEAFYWLDFCWIWNFLCNIFLGIYALHAYISLPSSGAGVMAAVDKQRVREVLFCTFFGIATGPLSCAVGALGNALVFHDSDNTVSVFIHLGPTLLAYTLRWNSQAVLEAWPALFDLSYFSEVRPWRDVYLNAAAAYLLWWLLYLLWLLTCGLRLPSRGYDTVFHSIMRGGSPIPSILGWSKEDLAGRVARNDFTAGSAAVYMLFHAAAVLAAVLLSVCCWLSQHFHGLCCLGMALAAIYRGSQRYAYYVLDVHLREVRREFGSILD